MSDILGMLNLPQEQKPSKTVSLALLLRHLATLLEENDKPDEPEAADSRATEPEEIRVRPRIEPLGG
jgi:hypothetical protein